MKKFWNWLKNDAGERTLRLDGPIDEESLWGDEITPEEFREELEDGEGDVTVWINSPGGNVFAAAEIYTMLKDYAGKITVKIDAIAASAASVIAMAGDRVLMSPVAMMMIHDPSTVATGNARDMEHAISVLTEVKESIVNAYAAKTGLSREEIGDLMANESWMNAKKAVELGFADEILYDDDQAEEDEERKSEEDEPPKMEAQLYSGRQMNLSILNHLGVTMEKKPLERNPKDPEEEAKDPAESTDEPDPDETGDDPDEEDPDEQEESDDSDDSDDSDESEAEEETEDWVVADDDSPPRDKAPSTPVIGMDGTTEDGSVPYLILEKQLECLR